MKQTWKLILLLSVLLLSNTVVKAEHHDADAACFDLDGLMIDCPDLGDDDAMGGDLDLGDDDFGGDVDDDGSGGDDGGSGGDEFSGCWALLENNMGTVEDE
jgi:hypothetical protein